MADSSVSIPSEKRVRVATWSELLDREPKYALVAGVDLVVVRFDDQASVLYGRCLHRGALMADGYVDGDNLMCGIHHWDYRLDTGVSEYNNKEVLQKFRAEVDLGEDAVFVDESEIAAWADVHPQPYQRNEYLGLYQDVHGAEEEPQNNYIQQLARDGLSKVGHHGPASAMGVPQTELPRWDQIQILTAQLARKPLLDEVPVASNLVIGPRAKKPLQLDIPLFVSDMSFGALSEEAKVALSMGAELAGTGICSGEGGMLPEEQAANSRYLYELATGRFGWSLDKVAVCQAFHFKAGQGAKTGTGGHLPGNKVIGKIADVRDIPEGQSAISPATFADLHGPDDYRALADQVRDAAGGIPIGFKLSAQHIEEDIDFALEASADYIILDGRGGGTGAAPEIFKSNISVPTMAAVARARRHLDSSGASDVTLIATGGLRTDADFVKAMALGADGIALANSAIQAIGCLGMRACNTNNCPVGIATQKPGLRSRLVVEKSAERLKNFFEATVSLMS
ncbi:MAG: glutamate synthase-related protein, partial [Planctomycetota bacterium]